MNLIFLIFACVIRSSFSALLDLQVNPRVDERYDLSRLQWDNRPVWWIAGRWQNDNPGYGTQLVYGYPYGDVLDFGIGEMTVFGARPLNYTAQVLDASGRPIYSEHGFLPVKNATKREPDIYPSARIAFLTTSDRGWTLLEEGLAEDKRTVRLNMTNLIRRSFTLDGGDAPSMNVVSLKREFYRRGEKLFQTIRATANGATDLSTTIVYSRVLGWDCYRGCNQMVQFQKIPDACLVCS